MEIRKTQPKVVQFDCIDTCQLLTVTDDGFYLNTYLDETNIRIETIVVPFEEFDNLARRFSNGTK